MHVMVEDLRTQRDRAQAELEGERTRAQVAVDALALARIQTLDLAIRLGRLETLIVTGRRGAIDPTTTLTLGEDVGEGSVTLELPAGKHTIVGTGQWTTGRRAVALKAAGKESVNLALEKGALSIDAPPGCDVIVDGKKVGRTPIDPIELFTGQHPIVVKQGVVEYKQTLFWRHLWHWQHRRRLRGRVCVMPMRSDPVRG